MVSDHDITNRGTMRSIMVPIAGAISRNKINNLSYTDGTTLLGTLQTELVSLLNGVEETCNESGLHIEPKQTT